MQGSNAGVRCREITLAGPAFDRAGEWTSPWGRVVPFSTVSVVAMLQVTPNGPWGKDVHPNMPVSLAELLADLRECFRAGATGVHLHVRDASGAETLDPAVVNETCRQVRDVAAEV